MELHTTSTTPLTPGPATDGLPTDPCGWNLLTEWKSSWLGCQQVGSNIGQGPKAQLSPSKVQVLAKKRGSLQGPVTLPGSGHPAPSLHPLASAEAQLKRQISVAGSLRARSPDPAQPSSLREPGAQDPAGPQASRVAQMQAGLHGLRPMETATTIRSQSWGWGRGSLLLQGLGPARGLLWPGLQSPAGHSLPPVPGVPQLARQPEARGPGGPRGEPRSASHHTVCHEDPCKADS
ncbi:uncharacterized protein [Sagmatias obliquidens]|uniref:uncharacterized protein n=1 Tax=Sagmatias obliquidens TaxID=3371155 RepID=UPI000F440A62|nr:uncharacterized protein LOC113607604 [Lagenorhynchus obliquidens]